jgi:dipeptidyl aminopeptidase/acylaminoacyl peptidase
MRDAIISGYAPNVEFLGGYLAYKEGQLAIKYLVDKYGIEKVGEVFKKGKVYLTMDKALKRSIGLDQEEFSEDFLKYCRKLYWPEIAKRSEAKDVARQLTDHTEDGSYFNERPAFSPTGDRLAIFTDRSDYTEIVVISTVDGEMLSRVVKGSRSADYESLHSYVSGLSWSPDGESIAFMSQSKGEDALRLVNVKKGETYANYKFDLDAMFSPSWGGENGNTIVFTGIRDGQNDLYGFDLVSERLTQLTDDYYEDQEPAMSPDGEFVVFASDRPSAYAFDPVDIADLRYGEYNLYTYHLETGALRALTTGPEAKRYPTWSPDGSKICFVSNYNGIDNLYIIDTADLRPFPITDILTNAAAPSWSPKGDAIAFSSFGKAGFDIFLLKNIKPIAGSPDSLERTVFAAGEMDKLLSKPAIDVDDGTDSLESEDWRSSMAEESHDGFQDYVFRSGESSGMFDDQEDVDSAGLIPPGERDSVYRKGEDGEWDVKPYKAKFSPDLMSGGLSYDTFFGLRGQSYLMISDYLGNHQFFLATDLVNAIDQTNFQFFYLNTEHRIDWGLGIFHMKNYYIDPIDRLFSDRLYGLGSTVSYPFSKFSRLELDFSHLYIDRKYYDPPYSDSDNRITTAELSWVTDNILWGITGPTNGRRCKITLERTVNIYSESVDYWALQFDFRKYYHFARRYGVALRAAGGVSDGANSKQYYLGGTSNWIGSALPGLDVYGVENLYFSKVVTPLRGYNYYEVQGTRFAVANIEFRFPFIEYFAIRFPLPIVLSQMRGAMFLDVGAAWNDDKLFKGVTTDGEFRLSGIKTGFGYGARVNLGFMVMKFDQAWKTDLNKVSDPKYYFSLGAEF